MKLRLRAFMREMKFNSDNGVVFGIYEGYLASITDKGSSASLFVDITLDDDDFLNREKLRTFVELNARQFSVLRAEVKNTGVLVVFASSISSFSRLRDFFFLFIRQLTTLKIKGASVCTNCGETMSSFKIVSIKERLHTCDKECAGHLVETARSLPSAKAERRLFLPGSVGALFGALFGIVPFVILSRIGLHAIWSGVVIGLLAKGGYEFFGGKECFGKAVVLPLFSLAAGVPAVFLAFCYTQYAEYGERHYIYQFREIIQQMYDTVKINATVRAAMVEELLFVFAFAVLALLFTARLTKRRSKKSAYIVS